MNVQHYTLRQNLLRIFFYLYLLLGVYSNQIRPSPIFQFFIEPIKNHFLKNKTGIIFYSMSKRIKYLYLINKKKTAPLNIRKRQVSSSWQYANFVERQVYIP